jgi:parallel beta-helix repeat protein
LSAGDTVIVTEGTYNERVSVTKSGSSGNPITYQAQGTVVMQGFNIQANYIRLAGFEITNTPGTSPTDRSRGSGVYVSGSGNEISANDIHHSTAAGIYMTSSATNTTVGSNRVAYAVECGIYIQGSGNLIVSNDISHTRDVSGSDADGIRFFGSGNIVRKNYIHDLMLSDSPGQSPHIDAFQTWGPVTNYIFEGNLNDKDPSQQQGFIIEGKYQPTGSIIIRNNVFITRGTGYQPAATVGGLGVVTDVTIVNNTIVAVNGAAEYAIRLQANMQGAVVKNNAVFDHGNSTNPYIRVDSGATNLDIGFNSISKSNGQAPAGSAYPGDLWMVNPLFVDFAARDFHLQPKSPLANR